MESPGGVTRVPAERVGVIQKEMVAQRCVGVKVKGYGPNLPSGLRDRVGTGMVTGAVVTVELTRA